MSNIERRIERLERELGTTDERLVVTIRRFGDGDEESELQQMRCGDTLIDRRPDETEAEFGERAEGEALRLAGPFIPCVVMIETKRGTPCSEAAP